MPSSDLAYRALYTALDTKSRALQRQNPHRPDTTCLQLHHDVFAETSRGTAAVVYMFIVRSTSTLLPEGDHRRRAPHRATRRSVRSCARCYARAAIGLRGRAASASSSAACALAFDVA